MSIKPKIAYKSYFKSQLFSLIILSASVNFYSCNSKPSMVRTFEYSTGKEDALMQTQLVFEKLGYKISTFDEVDNYFTTRLKIINRLFRPIYYTIFVTAQDRLTIAVYSEVKTFKRASGSGIASNSDQIMQDASNNLGDKFQKAIFNPIIKEIESKGFARWDRNEDNLSDMLMISNIEDGRLWIKDQIEEKNDMINQNNRLNALRKLHSKQDHLRFFAVLEAENNIEFWGNNYKGTSLVKFSKSINSYKRNFDEVFQNTLNKIRNYYGQCDIQLVINPVGRLADIGIKIKSSSTTPNIELRDALISTFKLINFGEADYHIILEQRIDFKGSYNNLKVNYSNLKLTGILTEYTILDSDVLADTLFLNNSYNKPAVYLKN